MILTTNLSLLISFELLVFSYLLSFLCYSLVFSNFYSFGYCNVLLILVNLSSFLFYLVWLNTNVVFSNSFFIYYESFLSSGFSDVVKSIVIFLFFSFLFSTKDFIKQFQIFNYEYLVFLVLCIVGLLFLTFSNDLVCLYVSLEIQTLGCYTLAAYYFTSQYSMESGIKYFTVGSIASSFLLLGFVTFYFSFGFFTVDPVFSFNSLNSYFVISYLFILLSLLLKLGLYPFHQWVCDVYEGCLTTITLFFSTIPKLVVFTLLFRFVYISFVDFSSSSYCLLLFFSLLSIVLPSITALYQKRIKRLLGYSSISHVGFMVLSISLLSLDSFKSSFLYLLIYITLSFSFFLLILLTSTKNVFFKYLLN
jgi:NADH-quinone oxidoreductase subunit N